MRFEIRAIRSDEGASTHLRDAPDAALAAAQMQQQGYAVLAVRELRAVAPLRLRMPAAHAFPLGNFSHELLTLLEAGLSVVESFEALAEKEGDAQNRQLLERVVARLREGQSFSQALEQFPAVFPPLYVATVRASEQTGGLPEALGRYVAYQSQIDVLRKKIVGAAIYPVVLAGAGGLVMIFLLGYVVPRFAKVFEDIGREVPFMSRVLIEWGALVAAHGWTLLVCAVVMPMALAAWLASRGNRRRILEAIVALPGLGERMRIYQLARFYRTLGMLLRGGMPIVPSLGMTSDLLFGPLRAGAVEATAKIREGVPISAAMEGCGLSTAVSLRMLRVGERTGRMGEMMERIAHFYDDEISRWIDWFVRLFEPLLMAFIGVVIGAIVAMMYFPMFELAGSIQ